MHARRRRRLGPLVAAMQVLLVLLSFQISSVAHEVAHAFFEDDSVADCDEESEDSDCPPGCPTCHSCAHVQALYVPRGIAAPVAPTTMVTPPTAKDDDAPLFSFRDSVFRPPRA